VYEFNICVSRPLYSVLLKKLECRVTSTTFGQHGETLFAREVKVFHTELRIFDLYPAISRRGFIRIITSTNQFHLRLRRNRRCYNRDEICIIMLLTSFFCFPLLNRPWSFGAATVIMFLRPLSSRGRGAYATPSFNFTVDNTDCGIFMGAVETFTDSSCGAQDERSRVL